MLALPSIPLLPLAMLFSFSLFESPVAELGDGGTTITLGLASWSSWLVFILEAWLLVAFLTGEPDAKMLPGGDALMLIAEEVRLRGAGEGDCWKSMERSRLCVELGDLTSLEKKLGAIAIT